MLHSDQEPVLVQLLKAVQSRRVKRTPVRHGPRASHQSQGKIENCESSDRWCLSCDVAVTRKSLAKRRPSDSIQIAWLIRHAQVKNDGRPAFVRVLGKRTRAKCCHTHPCQQAIWIRDGANGRRTHHSH